MIQKLQRPIRDLLVNYIAASVLTTRGIRCRLYRLYGMNIKAWKINSKCYFINKQVEIGENTFVNCGCTFEGPIKIGSNCQLGYDVLMVSPEHIIGGPDRRAGNVVSKLISVGNGVWIGAKVFIMPGVTIGDGCIIGAGAVVNRDCEPNGLYAGVPARRIKDLPME